MGLRGLAFSGLLAAGVTPAHLILFQYHNLLGAGAYDWGAAAASTIVAAAPIVIDDLSVMGVVAPVVAAGTLAALAPRKGDRAGVALAVAICAVGWLSYVALTLSLRDGSAFFIAVQTALEGPNEAETAKAVSYLQGFAAAARVFFLVLGATLAGAAIRPAAPAVPPTPAVPPPPPAAIARPVTALALAAVLLLLVSPAAAGEIRVELSAASTFTVTATLRDAAGDPLATGERDPTGAVVFAFGPSLFTAGAYVEALLTIVLTPPTSAVRTREFTLELPVVLRRWRVADVYRIRFRPSEGVREELLDKYERLDNAADRWTKVIASLQQADHLAHWITPKNLGARRAQNTAVDGLVTIARTERVAWLRAPNGLYEQLKRSHEEVDDAKLGSLEQALHNVDSLVWKDLLSIEQRLKSGDCADASATFDYLAGRKEADQTAFNLQFATDSGLLAVKRQAAEQACAAGQAGAQR